MLPPEAIQSKSETIVEYMAVAMPNPIAFAAIIPKNGLHSIGHVAKNSSCACGLASLASSNT